MYARIICFAAIVALASATVSVAGNKNVVDTVTAPIANRAPSSFGTRYPSTDTHTHTHTHTGTFTGTHTGTNTGTFTTTKVPPVAGTTSFKCDKYVMSNMDPKEDSSSRYLVDMGINFGVFQVQWYFYDIKDSITITYEGKSIFSAADVGGGGDNRVTFGGSSQFIEVYVSASAQSIWDVLITCPHKL